jgi:hypothetical protein
MWSCGLLGVQISVIEIEADGSGDVDGHVDVMH